MSANISNRSFQPYTGEKARITRAYDYLILVLALIFIYRLLSSAFCADRRRLGFLGGLERQAMVAAGYAADGHYLSGSGAVCHVE